jgi:RimJ/RimL family protein N-acetyltransferase
VTLDACVSLLTIGNMPAPKIKQIARVAGHTLRLRRVIRSDAPYILSLRVDPRKSAYLSSVANDLAMQEAWIDRYLAANEEAYFIIEGASGKDLGTVRIYDARGTSFCWGSWIIEDGAPMTTAIESALMIYHLAIREFGFDRAHFEVDRRNQSVWKFHERFGARRVRETETEFHYTIDQRAIASALHRYARFLPNGIVIAAR